jgi:hypothetical protein
MELEPAPEPAGLEEPAVGLELSVGAGGGVSVQLFASAVGPAAEGGGPMAEEEEDQRRRQQQEEAQQLRQQRRQQQQLHHQQHHHQQQQQAQEQAQQEQHQGQHQPEGLESAVLSLTAPRASSSLGAAHDAARALGERER